MSLRMIFKTKQRMCLGTFWRLRWSLATSSLYAAVRILPEAFSIIGNAISYYTKKLPSVRRLAFPKKALIGLFLSVFYCTASVSVSDSDSVSVSISPSP